MDLEATSGQGRPHRIYLIMLVYALMVKLLAGSELSKAQKMHL